MNYQSVGVIGAGAWGTALAEAAARAGRDVLIWAYERETVDEINDKHTNSIFLPGVNLNPKIGATSELAEIAACDLLLLVVPSPHVRAITSQLASYVHTKPFVICTKGFEDSSNKLMSDVVNETLPHILPAVMVGPSFAAEVARGLPAALTLAVRDERLGQGVAKALGSNTLRLYWTGDMLGVQIGSTVKNVLAIASGIVVGRGLGANAQAGLITRGFAEMMRFGVAMGAREETLAGLSGFGDLILTCYGTQSRNMSLGVALGEGKTLAEVLGSRRSVSEGTHAAATVVARARTLGVEMPICDAVRAVLAGEVNIDEAIAGLLSRPQRSEPDKGMDFRH